MKILIVLLPWKLKRWFLEKVFGYEIHPTARIGLSWIFPKRLFLGEGARIGHLNVAIHLDTLSLGSWGIISRSNWITGYSNAKTKHFSHREGRDSRLIIGEHSAITKNHHIDCTDSITVGKFATIAGYYSQFLTHSIDIYDSKQDCKPIVIGDYTFVGTNTVVLGGAEIGDFCVVGAKSLVNKRFSDQRLLIGGVPARRIKNLDEKSKYFTRTIGAVS